MTETYVESTLPWVVVGAVLLNALLSIVLLWVARR
jgi:hypothetical protein